MKKVLGFAVVLCLMVAMPEASLFAASGGKQIVIKVANYYSDTHPQNISLNEVFKPMVEKESNGSIKVEIYPNSQLGAEKDFSEGTKLGTIEMSIMGMLMADKFPKLKLVEFPYIWDSVENGARLLNGEIGAEITEGFIGEGIRPLAWNVNGVRAVSNSKKPINTLADCKGIKLRVPQVKHYIDTLRALGFSVITMPMSEIFSALQQKVMDGQENPPTTVLTSGWYEVQKYIALTTHMIAYNIVAINEKFYQSLTADQKKIIEKAAKAFAEHETKLYIKAASADIETLKTKGIQITSPDLKPFKEACTSVHESILKEFPQLKPTYDKIVARQKK